LRPTKQTVSITVRANKIQSIFFFIDKNSFKITFKIKNLDTGNETISNFSLFTESTQLSKIEIRNLAAGSIDLTQFSITVVGKEVFTGAKEVYYAMEK
jgi:hypothetical protein